MNNELLELIKSNIALIIIDDLDEWGQWDGVIEEEPRLNMDDIRKELDPIRKRLLEALYA